MQSVLTSLWVDDRTQFKLETIPEDREQEREMKTFFLRGCHAVLILTAMLGIVLSAATSRAQVNVTTWHNDIGRTGQNTQEKTLTPSNVTKNSFGKICSAGVDGQIYAQPLTVWNPATSKNTVYVVTENDTIYAFDGTNCILIQKASLLPSNGTEYPADCCFIGGGQCKTVAPSVGVLSTPVIDVSTNTLYVVTESQIGNTGNEGQNCQTKQPPSGWVHRLHALDLTSGQTFLNEKNGGPVQIRGASPQERVLPPRTKSSDQGSCGCLAIQTRSTLPFR